MKKMTLYLAAAALLLLLGAEKGPGTEIARLDPVETIRLIGEPGNLTIETDTGATGTGATFQEALDCLKETAVRETFLETANYLLVSRSALPALPETGPWLQPNCRVCIFEGTAEFETVASYLQCHNLSYTLRRCWKDPSVIPELKQKAGGLNLES